MNRIRELRWLSQISHESGTASYTYDAAGNVHTKTDGRGLVTTYNYDALNRLSSKTYSDSTLPVTYGYDTGLDGVGHLTSVSNNNSTTNFISFDAMGDVTASNQVTGGQTYGFVYTYDLAGSLKTEAYPSGRVVTTNYDGAERPSTVSGSLNGNATNYVTQSAYWPQGAIYYFVRGNGLWSAAGYNDRLQPSEFYEATKNTDSTGNASSTGNMLFYSCLDWGVTEGFNNSLYPLCSPANTQNDNGTLLHYSEYHGGPEYSQYLSFTQTFTYDGANRLATAGEGSNWSRNFGYDQYGNMWISGFSVINPAGNAPQSQSSFNANNQITAGGAAFDAAGNQTVVNGDSLAYDAENRMVSAYDPILHSTETYVYDGNGERVQKSGPGGTTTYVYDAFGKLAAEYGAAPAAPCTTCYLSYDHLGSVRLVTDASGNVVARHDFLPFGQEIPANTAGRNNQWGSTTDVDTKFTGQIRDTETGMDFFNARYFTNALDRFNSPDPGNAGADPIDPQTWNAYSYVRNNPLALIDPSGEQSQPTCDSNITRGCVPPPTTDVVQYSNYVSQQAYANKNDPASGWDPLTILTTVPTLVNAQRISSMSLAYGTSSGGTSGSLWLLTYAPTVFIEDGGSSPIVNEKLTFDQLLNVVSHNNFSKGPNKMVACIAWVESGGNTAAKANGSIALGLMQMTRPAVATTLNYYKRTSTFNRFTVNSLYSSQKTPGISIMTGSAYLQYLAFDHYHFGLPGAIPHYVPVNFFL